MHKKNNSSKKIIYIIFFLILLFLLLNFSKKTLLNIFPKNKLSLYIKTNDDLLAENKNLKEQILDLEKENKLKIYNLDNITDIQEKNNFDLFNIISSENDNIYNALNIFIGDEKINENALVLSKKNNAIGSVEKINNKIASIKYFSKENSINNLFLKNYFKKDFKENFIAEEKKDDSLNENNENNNIKEDNIDKKNTAGLLKKEDAEKDFSDNTVKNTKQEQGLKNKKNLDSFNIRTSGVGNGFIFIEVPREYKISKDSVLFYLGEKKYPVAYFFEEKDSEQIPIKKVFYKMFENPNNLDQLKIKKY